jgi:hypothetical protein
MRWCSVWHILCLWDSWCSIKIIKSSVSEKKAVINVLMRSFSRKCGIKNGQIPILSWNHYPKFGGLTLLVNNETRTNSLQFTSSRF